MFAIILFSRIALKDKFATFKIRNLDMSKRQSVFAISRGLIFHENKILAKSSEFTVSIILLRKSELAVMF